MGIFYSRYELLYQALEFRHKTPAVLCEQFDMPLTEIHENLEKGNICFIKQLAHVLDIPEAFFWGGLRLEGGQLLLNEPG
ncbi:MAG: hypothetical protein ACO1OF_00710 [Adhaeribacter sp.]